MTASIETKPSAVNLGVLDKTFKVGDIVSPATLQKAGIVKKISGSLPKVKILGSGVLEKKLTVEGCQVSASAKLAIEKVGGSVK